jgi:hypothetical protein
VATVLDRPLQMMLDRSWVGGAAPRFEQNLARQRQALQKTWQRVLETMTANDAAEHRALASSPGSAGQARVSNPSRRRSMNRERHSPTVTG